MTNPEPDTGRQPQAQSQDVAIGGDFQVGGQGNRVDFSQTHVDLSQAHISQTQILQVAFDQIKTRPLLTQSPYLGLRKFEVRDQALFFGRDRIVAQLQTRLQQHFLLVLGASGSGKSSLIRAGLIAKLAQQRGAGFRELICTPDRNPFESVRASLTSAGYRQSATEFILSAQPSCLLDAALTLKADDDEWLIFIDQFEELFTLCQNVAIRQSFIQALVQLVQARVHAVDVILAMRADFLDRFSAYPALGGILERSELLTNLGDDELRLAIEQPAAHHGVVFEPGLVGEILQDLKGRRETGETELVSLPLLQYTLKLLWESSGDLSDRILRTSTYRQLGGVRGALQRRVDEIYNRFSSQEQQSAKRIFLQLVDTTSADAGATAVGKAVSHRAALSDFRDPAEQRVLEQLINASLLISDRPNPDSSAIVELAHETLIDSWDTLKSWIEESKPLIRLRHQLKEDANRWFALNQQAPVQAEADLWQGTKLQRLLAQKQDLNTRFGAFTPEELAFIQASETLADQAHRREIQQLRRTIAGIGAALVAVSGLGFLAMTQWIRAEQGQIQALSQTTKAEFTINRDTLPPLLTALQAGTRLKRLPAFLRPPALQADVVTALAQGVYWVREQNRLQGHTDAVEAVTFSPDGRTIATASLDQTVKLWNPDGQLRPEELSHQARVLSVDFSPDGQKLVSSSADGIVKLWTADGKPIGPPIQAHDGFVYRVRFNPSMDFFASAGADGTVKLWNFEGGLLRPFVAHDYPIRDIDFSADGLTIATASDDGTIGVWDLYGRPKANPLAVPDLQGGVNSVRFSPDRRWLASGGDDGKIRLWAADTGQFEREFRSSDDSAIWQIAFSQDSHSIAAARASGAVEIWDIQGNLVATLNGHTLRVKGVSFSPDGQVLASASADNTVKLWRINYGSRLTILEPPGPQRSDVSSVSISPDRRWVAAARADSQVALWDLKNPDQPILNLLPHAGIYGTSVSFNQAGDRLASADLDNQIQIWSIGSSDPAHQAPVVINNAHQNGVYGVSFNPQNTLLASGGGDQLVKLWDTSDLDKSPQQLPGHKDSVNQVKFSPDGDQLISTSKDNTAIIWDRQSGSPLLSLKDFTAAVWGVDFSPDGDVIATGSADNAVRLWDRQGHLLHRLEGHTANINSVQFSADSQRLFSASDDQTIKVWDRQGTLLATLLGPTSGINGLSLNGNTLASGSTDGQVILWNLDLLTLDGLLSQGCAWVQDYLQTTPSDLTHLCDGVPQSTPAPEPQ